MPIDRTGRDRLRNALIGYMQMHITSKPFEMCDVEFCGSKNPDRSIVLIADMLYNIFDDFSDHLILPNRQRVELLRRNPWPEPTDDDMLRQQKEYWLYLCRAQAFLKTDLEIDQVLKYRTVTKQWKRFIGFFPFASAEEAEKYKDSWLDFTPPFDPAMMTADFEKARKDMKAIRRLPYWRVLAYAATGLFVWYVAENTGWGWLSLAIGGSLALTIAFDIIWRAILKQRQRRAAHECGGDGG